ncbi:MAG: transglycosylase family protein [Candidatus Parvarchaeum sp.]
MITRAAISVYLKYLFLTLDALGAHLRPGVVLRELVFPPPALVSPVTNATSTNTPTWKCIRRLESGDNYHASGLELDGGAYQFNLITWSALGFTGVPNEASRATQDRAALKLYQWDLKYTGNGFSAWQTAPSCGV